MEHQKIDPRISTIFFEIKNSKASLTTTLIWRLLYKLTLNVYSLILFQLPFSPSFESLFHQTNVRDSAVIQAQAFSVAQNVPKWRQRVNKHLFSQGTVCTSTFWGDPLLDPLYEKGPLKLQKGAHLTLIGQFLEETLYYYELKIPSKSKLGIAQQRKITLKFQK